MKTQTYCIECQKTSWLEIKPEEFRSLFQNQLFSPSINNNCDAGLITRSISHGDHILLLEIDKNGTIRKENVVKLISTMIENIVAHTVEKVINFSEINEERTILYISNTHAFMFFFKSVLSILMLNINDSDYLKIEIQSENTIQFTYNKLSLIYTTFKYASNMVKNEHFATVVVDLEKASVNERQSILNNKKIRAEKIILAYNSKNNKAPPLNILVSIMKFSKNRTALLDYATGQGFFNIVDASF